jgi:hypothetical protein
MVAGGSEVDSGVGATGTDGTGAALTEAPGIGALGKVGVEFPDAAGVALETCGATAGITEVANSFVTATAGGAVAFSKSEFVRDELQWKYNPIPTNAQISAMTENHFFI